VLPASEFLATLNSLHALRFFDMPGHYGLQRTNFLAAEGTVGTAVQPMADTGSTRLCVAIADYRKCVAYERDPPPGLGEFVQRLYTDMADRAATTGPRK
jgi:hypothetical protein